MNDLERALREAPLPGEAQARERVRRSLLAVQAATPPRRRAPRGAPLVWLALAAAVGAVVLTQRDSGPARAVERLVRDAVQAPRPAPAPANGLALPARGRLLVAGAGGAWIVERGGRRHRLGGWSEAAWSPNGLFVAVADGRTLAAVEPAGGRVRWRLELPGRVHDPRWAPDLTHIAYRAGATLRIVYANGIHDVAAGEHAAVAPAWRPGAPHTLAWASARGTVTVEDADTGKVLYGLRGGPVRGLTWSADGARLLVAGRRHATVHDLRAGTTRRLRLAHGEALLAAAYAPRGNRLALAVRTAGGTAVRLDGGPGRLWVPGRLRGLTWSADGRWLLADWPAADQWLLAPAAGRGDPRVITGLRRRFGASARPEGWR